MDRDDHRRAMVGLGLSLLPLSVRLAMLRELLRADLESPHHVIRSSSTAPPVYAPQRKALCPMSSGNQPQEARRHRGLGHKTVAELLSDLGVTKSHSRPRTSNDNPFSEAQFKTMKYSLYFPGSFAGIGEGRGFFELFMNWYNQEHHHSGIAMMTPATVHLGRIDEVIAIRQATLDAAYERHPERFVRGRPVAARPSGKVWINRPTVEVQVAEQQTSEVGAPQEEPHAETGARQGGHPCEPERRADEPAAGAR